jgi:hypothetical protein
VARRTGVGDGREAWVLVAMLSAACGRVAFEPNIIDADAVPDSLPALCGDGVCVGQSGELCVNCTADCATLAKVCGNGVCEPDEQPACVADCGPAPWPWGAEANEIIASVNAARQMGVTCASGGGQVVGVLAYDATLEAGAREFAWEAAHQNWAATDGCNGRTGFDRLAAYGASSVWKTFDASSSNDAVAQLLAFDPACPELMRASNTRIGAAAAHDLITSHAIMLR